MVRDSTGMILLLPPDLVQAPLVWQVEYKLKQVQYSAVFQCQVARNDQRHQFHGAQCQVK